MKIEDYQRAIQNQATRGQKYEADIGIVNELYRETDDNYSNKIHELERQRRDALNIVNGKKTAITEDFEARSNEDKETIEKFRKILEFKELVDSEKDTNYDVYIYDYPRDEEGLVIRDNPQKYPDKERQYIKPKEILVDNEFSKIGVYIYKNKKPVNFYSISLIGRTIFGDVSRYTRHWGGAVSTDRNNIEICIKDASSMKELEEYWERNKKKLTASVLGMISKDEAMYREVKETTSGKEWDLALLEKKKKYYEDNYSRGTETPEYNKILNKIERIKHGI